MLPKRSNLFSSYIHTYIESRLFPSRQRQLIPTNYSPGTARMLHLHSSIATCMVVGSWWMKLMIIRLLYQHYRVTLFHVYPQFYYYMNHDIIGYAQTPIKNFLFKPSRVLVIYSSFVFFVKFKHERRVHVFDFINKVYSIRRYLTYSSVARLFNMIHSTLLRFMKCNIKRECISYVYFV